MTVKRIFPDKPLGLHRQVLTVNSSGSDTEWSYPGQILLAAYSGTANVVVSNIPSEFHEVRVLLATGGSQASHKLTNFVISSGTASTVQSSNFGVDHDTTFITTTLDGETVGVSALAHPSGAVYLGEDGSGHNVIDIRIPDFANASGANHTERSIYSLSYSPPGTTAEQGFTVATTSYSLTDGSARITGFTIALNSVDTRVYVYGL
jgi:hypothetical protein